MYIIPDYMYLPQQLFETSILSIAPHRQLTIQSKAALTWHLIYQHDNLHKAYIQKGLACCQQVYLTIFSICFVKSCLCNELLQLIDRQPITIVLKNYCNAQLVRLVSERIEYSIVISENMVSMKLSNYTSVLIGGCKVNAHKQQYSPKNYLETSRNS